MKSWTSRIELAESGFGKVKDEYGGARNYYEDEQTPSDIPSNKDYIQENIITDTIDRSSGALLSGEIHPILVGGGDLAENAKQLHTDILEANDFKELILPVEINKFYCEGLGGFKFVPNPYREDRYGIGFPEIYGIPIGRLLLDPDSITGMHDDDNFRIHKERRLKDYALEKWGRTPKGNKSAKWHEIEGAVAENQTGEQEYVEVYEIEYWQHQFSTTKTLFGPIRKERKVYYMTTYINKTIEVQKPVPTGYPCFRLVPMIHTPRRDRDAFGCYPMGLYKKLAQQQDQMNITASVVLDAVKSSIKNLTIVRGQTMDADDEIKAKLEVGKTDGFINLKNPNSRLEQFAGHEISPALLQWHQWQRQAYDDVKGSSSQAQQFQSAASGQLSGTAINNLQFAGTMPEYAKKPNIEFALKSLSLCIFHYIKTSMGQPFSITREIEGKEQGINFNSVGSEENQLSELGFTDVKLEVEFNTQQTKEMELNKALILSQNGKLSDKDLMQAAYPNSWIEKLTRSTEQNQAMALVQEMIDIGGEDFVNFIGQEMQKYKGAFQNGELAQD